MEDHAAVEALVSEEHEVVHGLGGRRGIRAMSKVPVVVFTVAVYVFEVSIVIGRCGRVLLRVDRRLGARRASSLDRHLVGLRLQLGVLVFAATVVLVELVLDSDPTVLFPPDTAKAMPTMAPSTTTTMTPLRIRSRRLCCWASAARRASRAAR